MNICIVTVYNSENCGSMLQAYALSCKLEELGHSVVFLNREIKGTGASKKSVMKVILKAIATGNFKNAILKYKFHKKCKDDRSVFRTVKIDQCRDIDIFVLGSDTIWQLDSKYFCTNFDRYWGLCFKKGKVISYAPSINGTLPTKYFKNKDVSMALEKMSAISVRDTYSQEVLSTITNKNIEVVCDPTMLQNKDFYKTIQRDCPYDNFILIYAFRSFCSKKQIRQIKSFAMTRKCQLISFGVSRSWCDISVPFDTFSMPSYYDKASYVITNTFHGNVFSLIYEKPFVNFATESRKVIELLKQFNLSERTCNDSRSISEYMDIPIDVLRLRKDVGFLRNKSLNYLVKNLIK